MAEKLNLDECFQVAEDAARKVGEIICSAFETAKDVQTKSCMADLVTETDKIVEETLISIFRSKFPSHSFIGEESAVDGVHAVLTDNPTWIIDPIDGTTNFVHRFPYIAVSIALVVDKKTEIAIVYNPVLDDFYTARPGHGAFCNGMRLRVTNVEDLGRALVCAEFGSSRDPTQLDSKFSSMRHVLEQAHGIRSLGSAALNMCLVAGGRADAYWEYGIHAWDMAAGDLIVREAGGLVMNTTGGALDLMARQVLCSGTRALAMQISKFLEPIEFPRD